MFELELLRLGVKYLFLISLNKPLDSISACLSHQKEILWKNSSTEAFTSLNGNTFLERLEQNVKPQYHQSASRYITQPNCFRELGCFPNDPPWISLTRMVPEPAEPQEIGTALYLYTRTQAEGEKVILWPKINLQGTNFSPKKPTAFITHGFATNTTEQWMHDMKDSYLNKVDANVFLVDWGNGTQNTNYLHAVSNTRIVGAELARFGRHIVEIGQLPEQIHAVGHSLGAHISGYFGKGMASINSTIGRITGLDPAQPLFEFEWAEVKLSKNDAILVDAIHTDAKPFIPFFGFGMIQPVGHIDFYINGGSNQPGCLTVEPPPTINALPDLATMTVETLSKWVSCSHGRAHQYFTWSLKLEDCFFVGRKMRLAEFLAKLGSLGTLSVADPVLAAIDSCTEENCNVLGLLTASLPARGIFAVSTDDKPPFCKPTPEKLKSLIGTFKNAVVGLWDEVLGHLITLLPTNRRSNSIP